MPARAYISTLPHPGPTPTCSFLTPKATPAKQTQPAMAEIEKKKSSRRQAHGKLRLYSPLRPPHVPGD
ncbi:hypothetical protein B0H19DRAFT_1144203 [Mycena capillaripes]|nr:hypothetical protein B0H19DRAFT_1144203 [Mycena capillaripes]